MPAVSGGKIGSSDLTSTILDPQVTAFLSNQPAVSGKPKAYLNWVLFDEQFKLVAANSGAEAVGSSGEFKEFNKANMPVDKNGYLYIYVSNETSYDVFFDNLQVTHVRGALLEESHYYPFGLTMAGISSKALSFGGPENKKWKFQNQELDDDLGLNWYQFKYRNYDPQIGRFVEIDPLGDDYRFNSLYAFSENRVINGVELEGLEYANYSYNKNGMKEITRATAMESRSDADGKSDASFKMDVIPGVGDVKGVIEAFTGKDMITGEKLGWGSRLLGLIFLSELRTVDKVANVAKAEARAAKLSKTAREGKDFTKAGKEAVKDLNKAKNDGKMICENCKAETVPGKKSTSGEAPPKNEAQVDHIDPKAKNGSGTPDNGQVLCRECNLRKGAN